jgi:crotonobetainyl-CoA:carnitine CoA-transferase CaiB-like acyl-CoA transferase
MGPWASQMLGDMGAEVIKVEPVGGDIARQMGPARHPGMAAVYLGLNRNKRSMVLDLAKPKALEVLGKVLERADVLLHNQRPKVAQKLGLDREKLLARFPRLILCEAFGFARGGPLADKPAYDDVIQTACGLTDLQAAAAGQPRFVPTIMADKTTAYQVATSICAALFSRERTGRGQVIEVPMFECLVENVMVEHLYGKTFDPPLGGMGYQRILTAERRPYPTLDGFVTVLPYTDENWKQLLKIAGREDLIDDPRMATHSSRIENSSWAYGLLAEIVATRTTREWVELLDAANVPVMPLNTLEDLLNDPQLDASGFWSMDEHPSEGRIRRTNPAVRFGGTPSSVRRLAPTLGQHTKELLEEAGLPGSEIEALTASGVVRCGTA